MSLNIAKLNAYQSWTRVSSGYNTAQAINATSNPLTFSCANFPAGVYAIGDWIQIEYEYMQITAVNDVANTLTVVRTAPVAHDTNKVIFFAGVGNQTMPILIGDQISNQTRAGEAIIVDIVNDSFGEDTGVRTLKFLVLSGAFQAGDHIHCAWGGSFNLGKVSPTLTTEETILIKGTMNATASGSTISENLDDTETEIDVSLFSNITVGKIIKIDSEIMLVEASTDATPDTIKVKRGLLGTTPASHTSGATIYILDDNLMEQILDADVSNAWGLSTISNGRIQLNCHIFFGRTDNTENAILISSNEIIDNKATASNKTMLFGNQTYRTHFMSGKGYFNSGTKIFTGENFAGSILKCNIIKTHPYTTFYAFGTNIQSNIKTIGAIFLRKSILDGNLELFNADGEDGKIFDVEMNGYFNPATENVEIKKLKNNNKNSEVIYWVWSIGDAEFREFETPEENEACAGFIARNTKIHTDCKCPMYFNTFWGDQIFLHRKSFNAIIKDEQGNPIEEAIIKCDYEDGENIFIETTDENGMITEKFVEFYKYQSGVGLDFEKRNIKWQTIAEGYKNSAIERKTIGNRDDGILYTPTLEKSNFKNAITKF